MEPSDTILALVSFLQAIVVGLLFWMGVTLSRLDREVGELKQKVIGIITQSKKESEVTDRRLDSKKDKSQ